MIHVLSRTILPIRTEEDVVLARRKVQTLARQRGFDAFATAALTTATSELSRNIVVHAGEGQAALEEISDGQRLGIRIEFRDSGPGIADLDRAMGGGYSTRRSLGLGLSGSKRLVDSFEIDARTGQGTTVRVTKWTRF